MKDSRSIIIGGVRQDRFRNRKNFASWVALGGRWRILGLHLLIPRCARSRAAARLRYCVRLCLQDRRPSSQRAQLRERRPYLWCGRWKLERW